MNGIDVKLDYETAGNVTCDVLKNSASVIINNLYFLKNKEDVEYGFRVIDCINVLLDYYEDDSIDTSSFDHLRPKDDDFIFVSDDNMNYTLSKIDKSQVYNPHLDVLNQYDYLPSDVEPR